MKKSCMVLLFLLLTILLTGCMYPEDKLVQNRTPYEDQIQSVQSAVDQFQKDNGGILPIKTFKENTPVYQRYQIDFKKLVPKYMAEPPGNSYENGGVFQYVVVDAEKNPSVKIFDLRIAETISEIKLRISTQGYPPYKGKAADHVFTLDYKKLGYEEEPYVVSPYTENNLSFVIDGNTEIYVDYSSDLYEILKSGKHQVKKGDDIRDLLWEDSMFVPAYSLPYTVDEKTNEPIFLTSFSGGSTPH